MEEDGGNRPLPLSEPTTLDLQSHPPLPSKPSPSPFRAFPFSIQSHPLFSSEPSSFPSKSSSFPSKPSLLPSKPSPSPFKAIPLSLQTHPTLPSKPSPSPSKAIHSFLFPSKAIPVSSHLASDTGNSIFPPNSPAFRRHHLHTRDLHPLTYPKPPPTCTPETSTHLHTQDLQEMGSSARPLPRCHPLSHRLYSSPTPLTCI
ncbi:hypothetical protein Pcinc_039317 [Petrolisthes cinctipes]|uniref:Uncharacterized protein n=1 Tax=Petrolisthes cinctipes TaxID=88211 RepID=A0AAE1EM16_PETCI|nr:hypothetical protein Pcinc_039317 [Petrolisthes cinctipes]